MPTTQEVERLMKRCQIGVGGRNALDTAHDIMAECYGTLGALVQERDKLRTTMQQVLVDAQAQDVLAEWWPMMETALMGPNAKVTGASPALMAKRPVD